MPRSSQDSSSTNRAHETRQLILQVAQRLFMQQGYSAVSTRDIAAACGITQPALYRHFATKQELYVAVLLEVLNLLHGRLLHLLERNEDVLARLYLIARMLPATWIDASQMFHDIEHQLDAEHRQATASAFQHLVLEPIAALFHEGIEQGLLRSPAQGGLEAHEATFVLFRLLDDSAAPSRQSRSRLQHADRMVDLLLYGLLQQSESQG
ncbi:TetR family transcriptional regulator [Dictyobacter alpinus]|uniref:TetR family transcriptional regulator n=1 Tax=Dictyobacter alpinus TaxID=2014873 RepID=A0A402BDN7_9CHLR|nr:TetR/AcrR family transcriptional regulator [Dictyobacter alpinus]GCE29518.1 TetR family transcriptional regulator [Dictyobacter alpinus]